MLDSITLLLFAQLVGEVTVRAINVPVPGPVLGGMFLAAYLAWRGITPAMQDTSQTLLRNLSLLFVPAGVGVIQQWGVIADYWLALSVSLVVSTVATLTVTVLVFDWANRRFGHPDGAP